MAERKYAYKITLRYYSGKSEWHYIYARNNRDAFDKAHRFCNPFDPHDGVQFIEPEKITKKYIAERNITIEEDEDYE